MLIFTLAAADRQPELGAADVKGKSVLVSLVGAAMVASLVVCYT